METTGENVKFYRCGYCGIPTDQNGKPLDADALQTLETDKAVLVDGECCVAEQCQKQTITVTREMAIDAGDITMEGYQFTL